MVTIQIFSIEDLDDVRLDLTEDYELMNDLDFEDDDSYDDPQNKDGYITGSGWLPLSDSSDPFDGNFDGQNFRILNLMIDRDIIDNGLFGHLGFNDTKEVKNVHLLNVDITITNSRVGAITGNGGGTKILNCSSTGNITANSAVGGIAGSYTGISIENCFSSCNVTATSGTNRDAGGIAGFLSSGIAENCYATGNVDAGAGNRAGGLVGALGFNGDVNKCYSTGTVNGNSDVGGLVGFKSGTGDGEITNSFWDVNTSGIGSSGSDNHGATGKTTSEMQDIDTFTDIATIGLDEAWDMKELSSWTIEIWRIDDGNDYPELFFEPFSYTKTIDSNSNIEIIEFIGSNSSDSDTVTLPSHLEGDLLILFSVGDLMSTPSGWNLLSNTNIRSQYFRIMYKIAASSETNPTVTDALAVMVSIYRGVDENNPIGAYEHSQDNPQFQDDTLEYPSLSLNITNGSSWVVGLGGIEDNDANFVNSPSGMVLRQHQTESVHPSEIVIHDTGGGVSSWSLQTVTLVDDQWWFGATLEIRARGQSSTETITSQYYVKDSFIETISSNTNIKDTFVETINSNYDIFVPSTETVTLISDYHIIEPQEEEVWIFWKQITSDAEIIFQPSENIVSNYTIFGKNNQTIISNYSIYKVMSSNINSNLEITDIKSVTKTINSNYEISETTSYFDTIVSDYHILTPPPGFSYNPKFKISVGFDPEDLTPILNTLEPLNVNENIVIYASITRVATNAVSSFEITVDNSNGAYNNIFVGGQYVEFFVDYDDNRLQYNYNDNLSMHLESDEDTSLIYDFQDQSLDDWDDSGAIISDEWSSVGDYSVRLTAHGGIGGYNDYMKQVVYGDKLVFDFNYVSGSGGVVVFSDGVLMFSSGFEEMFEGEHFDIEVDIFPGKELEIRAGADIMWEFLGYVDNIRISHSSNPIFNNVTFDENVLNGSLLFNGEDSYVELHQIEFDPEDEFSISFWIVPQEPDIIGGLQAANTSELGDFTLDEDALGDFYPDTYLFNRGTNQPSIKINGYSPGGSSDLRVVKFNIGDKEIELVRSEVMNDEPYMVTLTYKDGIFKGYVNIDETLQMYSPVQSGSLNTHLGRPVGGTVNANGNFYKGYIGKFSIWKERALRYDEIVKLYNRGNVLDKSDFVIDNHVMMGLIDDVSYNHSDNDGYHIVLDGRVLPELVDKTITKTVIATRGYEAILSILEEYSTPILLEFWNGKIWVNIFVDDETGLVEAGGDISNFPEDLINLSFQDEKGWSTIRKICEQLNMDVFVSYDKLNGLWSLKVFNVNELGALSTEESIHVKSEVDDKDYSKNSYDTQSANIVFENVSLYGRVIYYNGENSKLIVEQPYDIFNKYSVSTWFKNVEHKDASILFCPGWLDVSLDTTRDVISYWRFDEGSGTTTEDVHTKRIGTLVGNASWTASGVNNDALSFTGGDTNYVNLGAPYELADKDFSISLWAYFNDTTVNRRLIESNEGLATDSFALMSDPDFSGILTFQIRTGAQGKFLNMGSFTSGSWHHIVVCRQGGRRKGYVNNVKVADDYDASWDGVSLSSFIPRNWWVGRNFNGRIDELSIYDKFLTDQEVNHLFNNTTYEDIEEEEKLSVVVEDKVFEIPREDVPDVSHLLVDSNGTNLKIYLNNTLKYVEDVGNITIGGNFNIGYSHILQPVSYWEFDEGTGNTTVDSHSGKIGTRVGSAGWSSSGKINNALEFPGGSSNYFEIESPYRLEKDKDMSLSFWVYLNTDTNGLILQNVYDDGSLPDHIGVSSHNSAIRFTTWKGGSGSSVRTSKLNVERWYHVCFTKDRHGRMKAYLDGVKTLEVPQGTYSVGDFSGEDFWYLGATSGGSSFNGRLDELSIYPYVLSDKEVKALFNENNGLAYSDLETKRDVFDGYIWDVRAIQRNYTSDERFMIYNNGTGMRTGIFEHQNSVMEGANLTQVRDFRTNNSDLINRVRVYGEQTSDNIIMVHTENIEDLQNQLWIKDRIINDSNLKTYDDVRLKALNELERNSQKMLTGRISSIGMAGLLPGQVLNVSAPRANINGNYRIDRLTHNISSDFTTDLTLSKKLVSIKDLFIGRFNPDDLILPGNNMNNMDYSYVVFFDEDPSLMSHSNTSEFNGRLRLNTGQTEGVATSNILQTPQTVTQCELRRFENFFTEDDEYEVTNDGGATWEPIVTGTGQVHTFSSTGSQLGFRVTLKRDTVDDPTPMYEAIALLYK